jgi:hypothetical protein
MEVSTFLKLAALNIIILALYFVLFKVYYAAQIKKAEAETEVKIAWQIIKGAIDRKQKK